MSAERPRSEFAERESNLRLDGALREVNERAVAFVPRFLGEVECQAIIDEQSSEPFDQLRSRYKAVLQEVESRCVTAPYKADPEVGAVAERLVDAVRRSAALAYELADYYPNEASVHRYQLGEVGISPHLDHPDNYYLIASLTLSGSAAFEVYPVTGIEETRRLSLEERLAMQPRRIWRTNPGDLVLLRAPGFSGETDGRPLHAVSGGSSGERMALILRHKA